MVVKTDAFIRSAAALGLRRGVVSQLSEDGSIIVTDPGGYMSGCEVIENETFEKAPLMVGDRVLYLPAENDDSFGCIIGRISLNRPMVTNVEATAAPQTKKIESEQIEIHANSNLLLKCGKGSISIRDDGTIVIKGTRLLSRSSGVNKVKGASVQIN